MAADLEAEAGSDTALPLIEQLRGVSAGRGRHVLATLRLRQSRFDEAAAALASAFVRLRVDPWPLIRYKQKALTLAEAIANGDRRPRARMFDALEQPFSLRALDMPRLVTRVDLAEQFDPLGRAGRRSAKWNRTCRGRRRC